jgi:hypothetical protein
MTYAVQPFWTKRNYICILPNPVSTQKMVSADLAILYDINFVLNYHFDRVVGLVVLGKPVNVTLLDSLIVFS